MYFTVSGVRFQLLQDCILVSHYLTPGGATAQICAVMSGSRR